MQTSGPFSQQSKTLRHFFNRQKNTHFIVYSAKFSTNKLPSTFYENRYGFSNKDLNASQFNNKSFNQLNGSYSSLGNVLFQQIRGFKTRRQLAVEEESFVDKLRGIYF